MQWLGVPATFCFDSWVSCDCYVIFFRPCTFVSVLRMCFCSVSVFNIIMRFLSL